MQINTKFSAIFTVTLLVLSVLPMVAASITLSYPRQLGYGNGTYVTLPAGTYSNVSRINNVWYVNGSVFPAAAVASPGPTAPAGQSGGINYNPWATPSPVLPSGWPGSPSPSSGPVDVVKANPLLLYFVVGVLFLLALGCVGLVMGKRKRSAAVHFRPY